MSGVRAEVSGIWACHPAIGLDDKLDFEFWSITHLPSGLSLPGLGSP